MFSLKTSPCSRKNRNLGENGLHFLDMTEYFIWKKKYILKK